MPNHPTSPPVSEARGRIAGERKFLTVLCSDLQRSTDLISELDPEEAISRLEPALIAMRTAVRRNRGIVRKEGGDGLIALLVRRTQMTTTPLWPVTRPIELVRRIKLLEDPIFTSVGVFTSAMSSRISSKPTSPSGREAGVAGGPSGKAVRKRGAGRTDPGIGVLARVSATGIVTFNALPPKRMEGFPALVPCYEVVEISGLSRWRAPLHRPVFHPSSAGTNRFRSWSARAVQSGPSGEDRRRSGNGWNRKVPRGP